VKKRGIVEEKGTKKRGRDTLSRGQSITSLFKDLDLGSEIHMIYLDGFGYAERCLTMILIIGTKRSRDMPIKDEYESFCKTGRLKNIEIYVKEDKPNFGINNVTSD